MKAAVLSLILMMPVSGVLAETITVSPEPIPEWKSVYGEVETRTVQAARARFSGTLVQLDVTEGDRVEAGEVIARIEDQKLGVQIEALTAQIDALKAQLANAETELARGQQLVQSGTISSQRLDALETSVEVLTNQISATEAQRGVIQRQIEEGDVLAPEAGLVLSVPFSVGSVVAPGEAIAQIGSGGVFLRLSVPERFAGALKEGDAIEIEGDGDRKSGTIAKLYPQIQGGRVQADVEVADLEGNYVGLRLPVRLAVGERDAILVPETAIQRGGGLDFVTVETADGPVERVVIPGHDVTRDGVVLREILTGLSAGDKVVTDHE